MPPPRGGGKHEQDIKDLMKGLAKCLRLHKLKCETQPPKPPSWCRWMERVPGTPEQIENVGNKLVIGGSVAIGVVGIGKIIGKIPGLGELLRPLPVIP